MPNPLRLLITAGPTQEPIDAVRFIGNRSSGRLGTALADEAARRGWDVLLALGPTSLLPSSTSVKIHKFRTTADLQALLDQLAGSWDVLIMAAAVADYRPSPSAADLAGKKRRTGERLVLELEPTPDLLAGVAARRNPGQIVCGFALEPRDQMLASARSKLERKHLDMIVANPLATMDGDTIEAVVLGAPGSPLQEGVGTNGPIPKAAFAAWLLDLIERQISARTP